MTMDDGHKHAGRQPWVTRASRQTLRQNQRLSSSGYRAVFTHGNRYVGRLMVMWVLPGGRLPVRVGIVASRRSFRRAVDRNRARRRLRETFRLNRAFIQNGYDLVLVARKPANDKPLAAIQGEFQWLCRKSGIWDRTTC